jgi:hypothetical protein
MNRIVRWIDALSDKALARLTLLLSALSALITTSFVMMLQAGI